MPSGPHAADRLSHLRRPSVFAAYEAPDVRRGLRQLAATVVPFVALWVTMVRSLDYGYWLTMLLAVPTAGFLVRLFLLQHDCAHRSFVRSAAANDAIGTLIGFLTLTPHYCWRRLHLLHHATSGNLDRRGYGDIDTLTVNEYLRLSRGRRALYRIYRHPLVLFGIAPALHFVVKQRWSPSRSRSWRRERLSVHVTNAGLLILTVALSMAIGFERLLLVEVPMFMLAASAGVWLFYVQHQFEDTYWDSDAHWDAVAAGIEGSSHYVLPQPLEWLTCCIGLHHIHHLSPRIPNYRLRQCLDENPALQQGPKLTIRQSLRCAALKLWDEDRRRLVPFPEGARALK
jgi:omega-6 fatty acid desaturase (delta-12 desaturase)